MSGFLKKHGVFFAIAVGALISFTTCNQPMGLGKPIDWEPPVLTLDEGYPNPMYVKMGTVLAGTVTDNIGVDRVIMREAGTTREMSRASVAGNRWELRLNFDYNLDNGRKIAAEIVAYDRGGNSGEPSIVALTLIVDLRPPVINESWIQRTTDVETKSDARFYFEPLDELRKMEASDADGTKGENANRYQNGWFYVDARASEDETRIKRVELRLYDSTRPNNLLLALPMEGDATLTAPRWFVTEEAILAAGVAQRGQLYADNYLYNNARYYYRVDIVAYDRSENSSDEEARVETQNYFCMWKKGDEPKGIVDPVIGEVVTRGTPLPVQFFDDDILAWAYADLFTLDQWNGTKTVASGLYITGADDDEKFAWLKQRLVDTPMTINNWKSDKRGTNEAVTERLGTNKGKIDDTWVYVPTGETENDYGDYILFTLAQDNKLAPHLKPGDADYATTATSQPQWKGRASKVTVIDDNLPIIVFDTSGTAPTNMTDASTGGSPEENTFPTLTNGQYFTINGYTMRENSGGGSPGNRVKSFHMVWIPNGISGGPDDYISDVQKALKDFADGKTATPEMPAPKILPPLGGEIKCFNFHSGIGTDPAPAGSTLMPQGADIPVGTYKYRRQVFKKQFDIQSAFMYNGINENETKVFVFCAIDSMPGKDPVFRTLRLLGWKTPPTLTVYNVRMETTDLPAGIPSLSTYANSEGLVDQDGRDSYMAALKTYQTSAYASIQAKVPSIDRVNDVTPSYQTYSRGATVKYWVEAVAEQAGQEKGLAIQSVVMDDITTVVPDPANPPDGKKPQYPDIGKNGTGANIHTLSFAETLPEVTQRVFRFTATDTLGNKAVVQRTMLVTSTAVLNDITTTSQSGIYGNTKTITLRANFSGLVKVTSTAQPQLNIRYYDDVSHTWKRESLNRTINGVLASAASPADRTAATLWLEFDFKVPVGQRSGPSASGQPGQWIETIYGDPSMGGSSTDDTDRPLKLNGATIEDAVKGGPAFIPGYTSGTASEPNWTTSNGSLQRTKQIQLDGINPVVSGPLRIVATGKTSYPEGSTTEYNYYFKSGETIGFILDTSKPVLPGGNGNPTVQYYLTDPNGTRRGPYQAIWQGPRDGGMYFTIDVTGTVPVYQGDIIGNDASYGISLNISGNNTIVDTVDNALVLSFPDSKVLADGVALYIDRSAPPAPVTTLNVGGTNHVFNAATTASQANTVQLYNKNPVLTVPTTGVTGEPYTLTTWYSLNGGVSWTEYPNTTDGTTLNGSDLTINNGAYDLWTRYIDRAGNIGAETKQKIHVNIDFPHLTSILATQANGWYISNGRLDFNLSFSDNVTVPTASTVSITLKNRGATTSDEVTLYATVNTTESTTVAFPWPLTGSYEMPDGLYVSAVNFSALRDKFGNTGPASVSVGAATSYELTFGSIPSQYTCPNLNGVGLKVDTVLPSVTVVDPVSANDKTPGNVADAVMGTDNKTITITFREAVQKGTGTITIKPHNATANNYAIPPVFANEGYYDTDGAWVAGLYDIYNTSGLTAADKNALTQSTTGANNSTTIDNNNPSMSRLALKPRTGQSAGPYMRLTHGLKSGLGYSGDYSNTANATDFNDNNSANGPNAAGTYMIPDTATKWVLDYNYSITQNVTALNTIRTVLVKAKFRWQEFDVTSSAVEIGTGVNANKVTITLPDPLLKGLQWELSYPDTAFTDMAGNPAPAFPATSGTGVTANYWFWSSGAQTPVIRVNRRSYDARAVGTGPTNLAPTTTRNTADPGETTSWNTATIAVTDLNGWGIDDFRTVHYRIETETPGAVINYNTIMGRSVYRATTATAPAPANFSIGSMQVGNGSITESWNGLDVAGGGTAGNTTATTWTVTDATLGSWVRPNLIRRTSNQTGENQTEYGSYTVKENGVINSRAIVGRHRGLRSYNKDATKSELDTLPLTGTGNGSQTIEANAANYQRMMSGFTHTEASKNYVVAQASINHGGGAVSSERGVEGIFRSVIALRQTRNNLPAVVEGSNIKNGMPSIAGFPVRDAEETGDNRFIKLFYRGPSNATGDADRLQFYWVSTEIVSQWYFILWNNGRTHQRSGEVNNYLTAGYGDLTFGFDLDGF